MNHDLVLLLPHVLAFLNLSGLMLLLPGYWAIRSGRRERHRRLMVASLVVGVLFLIVYLGYHAVVGHVPFPGQGMVRVFYFTILFTHIFMALVVAILVPITVVHALRGRFSGHVRIARWTLPVWLFVCFSGLVVYGMAMMVAV
ncbi:MAG: DUF420 domain-containing protein [Magnetococcales bacterium]|nr:DUF420 domain-containing protein [Magnetococcales bacterium]